MYIHTCIGPENKFEANEENVADMTDDGRVGGRKKVAVELCFFDSEKVGCCGYCSSTPLIQIHKFTPIQWFETNAFKLSSLIAIDKKSRIPRNQDRVTDCRSISLSTHEVWTNKCENLLLSHILASLQKRQVCSLDSELEKIEKKNTRDRGTPTLPIYVLLSLCHLMKIYEEL